jgi:hypothetical protein
MLHGGRARLDMDFIDHLAFRTVVMNHFLGGSL